MNEFTNIKILENPIRTHRVKIKLKNNTAKVNTELLPSQIDFTEGLWQVKLNNVVADNYGVVDKLQSPAYSAVFDVRSNLITTYERKNTSDISLTPELFSLGNFSKFVAKNLTLFSFNVEFSQKTLKHILIKNLEPHWFTVEAKAFDSFDIIVCTRLRMPKMPATFVLNFELELLFRRIK